MSRGGGHSARRCQSQHDAGYRDSSARNHGARNHGAAARGRTRLRRPHVTLNDDGQRHPMVNSLSLFTLMAGIVACVLGFLANQHGAGAWTQSERPGSG